MLELMLIPFLFVAVLCIAAVIVGSRHDDPGYRRR